MKVISIVALLAALGACADAPRGDATPEVSMPLRTIEARDTVAECRECRIVLDSIASIGLETDSVVPSDPADIVEGVDQAFYVTTMTERARVGVYDWQGKLVRLLGRTGEGPGELKAAISVAASRDSFLAVLDYSRILWYSLGGGEPITRVLPIPIAEFRTIALPGRGLVVAAEQRMPGRAFLYVDTLGVMHPFGDSLKAPRSGLEEYMPHSLTVRDRSGFFAMPYYVTPRLDEWELSGKLVRRYELPAPWFEPYTRDRLRDLGRLGPRGMRIAISNGAWRDANGLLWTIATVPDPRWKIVADTGDKDERGEVHAPYWGYDRRQVQDAVIAVYRLTDSSVTLVASQRVDFPLSRFLSDSVVAERKYIDRGAPVFNLFRYRLVR